ncbi:retrotransposon protein, putative, ty1-copia subclass [Tanacetum coccineum]
MISALVDSLLENIERFLNNFANETNMDDLESDDESVDTPLVSPFPHSDNDSDDGEVLNELIEYENVGMLRREKAINSFDGDDLAFQYTQKGCVCCVRGSQPLILALQSFLGHLGRRNKPWEVWDCQLGNLTAGKVSGGGGNGLPMVVVKVYRMALNNAQTKTNNSAFRIVLETPLHLQPAAMLIIKRLLIEWLFLDRLNEVACLVLGTIYLDQLAILNYVLPDKVSISFILNSLSSEFQAFVQNYNMQSIEKTISEVHSLLIEFEKSIKRNKQQIVGASSTPHVMAIQSGRVQKNKPQVSMNNMIYFNVITVNGIYEIDMCDSTLPIVNSMYSISNKRTKPNLDSSYLWHCRLAHTNKKRIEKLQHDGLLKPTDNEPFDQCLTPPYTPQHNGVFERRNRTLLNMVRSMMSLTTLLLSFWDYALVPAARILNMVLTKKVDKTPYELWHGKVPNVSYLKVWGCEAHVKRHTPDKLQQRSVKCIFVGYPKETMRYYFYYPPENKIVVERYSDFLEKDFILQKESGRNVELDDED